MPDERPVEELVPFHAWLEDHRNGRASIELAEELATVLQAVQDTGKKGQLKLILEIDPKGRTIVVTDRVETTVPKHDREAAVYFVSGSGSPVKHDPNQMRADWYPDPETGERKFGVVQPDGTPVEVERTRNGQG